MRITKSMKIEIQQIERCEEIIERELKDIFDLEHESSGNDSLYHVDAIKRCQRSIDTHENFIQFSKIRLAELILKELSK